MIRLLVYEVCGHTQSAIHLSMVLILIIIRGFIFVAIFIEISWRLCSILLLVELHLLSTVHLHLLSLVVTYLVQCREVLICLTTNRLPIRSSFDVTLANLDWLLFA